MNEWWRSMVHEREDVVGLDASIVMHPKVWQASGHLSEAFPIHWWIVSCRRSVSALTRLLAQVQGNP